MPLPLGQTALIESVRLIGKSVRSTKFEGLLASWLVCAAPHLTRAAAGRYLRALSYWHASCPGVKPAIADGAKQFLAEQKLRELNRGLDEARERRAL
jgi:hypothetical protein